MSDTIDLAALNEAQITFDVEDLQEALDQVDATKREPVVVGDVVAIGDGYDDPDCYLFKMGADGRVFSTDRSRLEDRLDSAGQPEFAEYLYDDVGIEDINDVEHQGASNYHIEHGWFYPEELEELLDADGVSVSGVDADYGYIDVRDVREE